MKSYHFFHFSNSSIDEIKSHVFKIMIKKSEEIFKNTIIHIKLGSKFEEIINNRNYITELILYKKVSGFCQFQLKIYYDFKELNEDHDYNQESLINNKSNQIKHQSKFNESDNINLKLSTSILIDFKLKKARKDILLIVNIHDCSYNSLKDPKNEYFYCINSIDKFDMNLFDSYLEQKFELMKKVVENDLSQINLIEEKHSMIVNLPIKMISSKISDISYLIDIGNDEGGFIKPNINKKKKAIELVKIDENEYLLTDNNINQTFKLTQVYNQEMGDEYRLAYKLDVPDSIHLYEHQLLKINDKKTLFKLKFSQNGGIKDYSKVYKEMEANNFLKYIRKHLYNQ